MILPPLLNNSIKLQRCTGLSSDQFKKLVEKVAPLWEEAEIKRLNRDNRKREIGAGHPYRLATTAEKLWCVLLWYKMYPAFWFLGLIVGLDAANCCKLVGKMRPLLEQAADSGLKNYLKEASNLSKRKRVSSWAELKEQFPEVAEILIDATEQQRQRPGKRQQKKYYSGKKRRHTVKTQVVVNRQGKVLNISKTYPGAVHDLTVWQKEKTAKVVPKKTRAYTDRGYQGINNDLNAIGVSWHTPLKKNRWNKISLTRSEKIRNTKLSKKRIVVENVLAHLKKWAVLAQVLRHDVSNYNQDFRNVAAIYNFRLAYAT